MQQRKSSSSHLGVRAHPKILPPPLPPQDFRQKNTSEKRIVLTKNARAKKQGFRSKKSTKQKGIKKHVLNDRPDVTHLLQPLPRISATSPPKRPLELAHTDRHVSPKTKGRSKGKSQQGLRAIRMPAGFEDGVPCTKAGNPVCFNHNLNGCHLQVTKGRCPRGLHACCYRGCHKMDHTYKDCPARRAATS